MDRRDFLKSSAGAVAVAAVGSVAKAAPNDVLRVGVIGVKGRGQSHIQGFETLPNAEVVAFCDIDASVLGGASDQFDKATGRKLKRFKDLRAMIDDKDIDIISIATPDHWHALAAVWSIQNGKDVYVEKPVSHNVSEGRKIVDASTKYKKIVQTGTQNRSIPAVREAVEFLRGGGIGKIHTAKGLCYKWRPSIGKFADSEVPAGVDYNLWLGPAPERPFNKNRYHYNWHWYWDYGTTDMGNQGVHQMDVARWAMGKDTLPEKIHCVGGRFGYEDDAETPNTQLTTFEYGDCIMQFEVRGLASNDEMGVKIGNIWYGSEGYLVLNGSSWQTFYGSKNKPGKSGKSEGGDNPHFANFVKAVLSRKRDELNADILEGHLSSSLCHLGNIAYRVGRKLTFDPKTETFGKDEEANRYLTREYRSPFTMPDKV